MSHEGKKGWKGVITGYPTKFGSLSAKESSDMRDVVGHQIIKPANETGVRALKSKNETTSYAYVERSEMDDLIKAINHANIDEPPLNQDTFLDRLIHDNHPDRPNIPIEYTASVKQRYREKQELPGWAITAFSELYHTYLDVP